LISHDFNTDIQDCVYWIIAQTHSDQNIISNVEEIIFEAVPAARVLSALGVRGWGGRLMK
jgi:hypothetical protein